MPKFARVTNFLPHPREALGDQPQKAVPQLAGETDHDETDPVWLKDKADQFMVNGDYTSAYLAYTHPDFCGTETWVIWLRFSNLIRFWPILD